ncbi:hypothetical protein Hdeb2414_s0230g00841331 [Helianthus debilis subsp. tardiflorus]
MTRLSPSSSDLRFPIPNAFPTVIVSFSSAISNPMNKEGMGQSKINQRNIKTQT